MNELETQQVINGSWGEVWVESDYMAEAKGIEATIEIEYEDIKKPRNLGTGKKMIGFAGTGSLTFYKVNSRFINLIGASLKEGKQFSASIISKLDDPDALGSERIALKNCTFESISLANWEAATTGEQEVSFSFEDYEPLDTIG